jgi:hypothetical protein
MPTTSTVEELNAALEKWSTVLDDLDAKLENLKQRENQLAEEREAYLLPAVNDSEAGAKLRNITGELERSRGDYRNLTAARAQAVAKRAEVEAEQQRLAADARRARIAAITDDLAECAATVDQGFSTAAAGFSGMDRSIDLLIREGVETKFINSLMSRGAKTGAASFAGLQKDIEIPHCWHPNMIVSMFSAVGGWLERIRNES